MANKTVLSIITFICSLTMYGQNTGQIDVAFQPNGTQNQSLEIGLNGDALHVKGSMILYDPQAYRMAYKIQEDSVYLKVVYRAESARDNILACDVDFSIPGCSGNSYIVSIDKDSDGEPYNDLCMEVTRHGMTNIISYEIKREDKQDRQELKYSLNNNELNITGYLFTNCCGIHSLVYRIAGNDLYIGRCDEEPLCDCQEAHRVDITIPDCTLPSYNIHLSPYTDDLPDTGENVLVSDPSGIDLAAVEGFSIRYEGGYCHVNFPINDSKTVWVIDLFDSNGKKVLSQESTGTKVTMPLVNFTSDVYVCKITCNKNIYIQKLVIP